MRVGALQETITVTGETPVVDVQNTKRETVLSEDVIAAIPATRAVGSLLNATPGLTVDNNGLAATPTMTFFSARGGQTNEGRMTVNGMTVAAAFNGGGVSSLHPTTRSTSKRWRSSCPAASARSDIGGPTMNLVPRSGGNTFSRPGVLQQCRRVVHAATTSTTACAPSASCEPPGIISAYDASVSLGGPIKRDRLWFFGSYRKLDTATTVEGIVANANAGNAVAAGDWAPDDSLAAHGSCRAGRSTSAALHGAGDAEEPRHVLATSTSFAARARRCKVEPRAATPAAPTGSPRIERDHSPEADDRLLRFPVLPDAGDLVRAGDQQAAARSRLLALRVPTMRAARASVPPDGIFDLIPVTEQSTAIDPATGIRYSPRANYRVPRGPDLQRQLRQPEPLARLGVVRDRRAQHEGRVSGKLAHCQRRRS